jgi:hypothetical protein
MVNHLMDQRNQGDLLKLKTQVEIAQKETLEAKVSDVDISDIATPVDFSEGDIPDLPANVENVREGDDVDVGIKRDGSVDDDINKPGDEIDPDKIPDLPEPE